MKKLASFALVCLTVPAFAETPKIPPTSTPEQIEAFIQADGNEDGALTKGEFTTFIDVMAEQGEPTAKFIRTLSAHSIAFSQVDTDRDGFARPFEIYEANSAFEAEEAAAAEGLAADK